MKKLELYINILHFVIYKFCEKYKKLLPNFPIEVNSGRILILISSLPGIQLCIIYVVLCKINNQEFISEFCFLFIVPFGLLIWFSVIHKDKYLKYFEIFERKSKEVKIRWACMSFGIVMGIIFLLIFSLVILPI